MPLLAYKPPEPTGSTPAAGPPPQPAYDPLSSSAYQYTEPPPDTAPTPAPDPTQSAEASYQYRADQIQATPPPATSPPPAPTDKYGQGIAEQYGQMQEAARTAEVAPVTGATSFGAPDPYHAVGADQYNPFPGESGSTVDRIRRKVGRVGSWYDTPTTPGSMSAPPPDNPNRGQVDPLGALAGARTFLTNYGPGGKANLVDTLINDVVAPYGQADTEMMRDSLNPNGEAPLPETLQALTTLARYLYFDNPDSDAYRRGDDNPMDQTDAYLGNDPGYLRRMASLPAYLDPVRPLIARGAHLIAKAPGASWSPPYLPGLGPQLPPEMGTPFPGTVNERAWSPEPGVYYDDPYIPGPDRARRRRTA